MCINSRRYVCCSECNVVSKEYNEPSSCLVQPIGAHCCEVMYFGCFGFRGELGFLNWDDIGMCVVIKQFDLVEFVYADLQYDEFSHIAATLFDVHWIPFRYNITFKICILTYRAYHRTALSYLCYLIVPYVNTRSLRSNDTCVIKP